MKTIFCAACLLSAYVLSFDSSVLSAAEVPATLPPELAPLARKHESDRQEVETARLAALKLAQTRYLTVLSGAEQSSGAAGKLPEVAAILKEKGERCHWRHGPRVSAWAAE